jgi:pantoate kinase
MKIARAFSPCHITGFFQIFDQSADPLRVGSKGAGVSLRRGVKTTAKTEKALKDSSEVKINGVVSSSAEVSQRVIKAAVTRLRKHGRLRVAVEHYIETPIGAGFGASGAAALSLALALNEALDLGMSRIEAAQLAHVAEVECKTGLGTVLAETFGGVEIRVKAGAPGIGEIKQIPTAENTMVVCISFGPLSTKKLLSDEETHKRVNTFGGELAEKLAEHPELDSFLEFSRQFAEHVGLVSNKARRVLAATDKTHHICSMPMFGESVFGLTDPDSAEELLRIFRRNGPDGHIFTSDIDFKGARVLT